jgi:hypothetical protein
VPIVRSKFAFNDLRKLRSNFYLPSLGVAGYPAEVGSVKAGGFGAREETSSLYLWLEDGFYFGFREKI